MEYLLAAVFLPLFPFSIILNAALAHITNVGLRILSMIVWPVIGILIVIELGGNPPDWVIYWAVFTALLYALRSATIRDLNRWTTYMATSIWTLFWLAFLPPMEVHTLWLITMALSIPLVILSWLAGQLQQRFGGVYAGAVNGLAASHPRLSALLVLLVLASISTPFSPGFFALLGMVNNLLPAHPLLTIGVLLLWLLWSWSGMRIMQGLIIGPRNELAHNDINMPILLSVSVLFISFVVAGVNLSGELL